MWQGFFFTYIVLIDMPTATQASWQPILEDFCWANQLRSWEIGESVFPLQYLPALS